MSSPFPKYFFFALKLPANCPDIARTVPGIASGYSVQNFFFSPLYGIYIYFISE
jgi:hypothetical protein